MSAEYFEYRLQRDCPDCGLPVIVNGPVRDIPCKSCGSKVEIGEKYWKEHFLRSETSGVFIMGIRIGGKPGIKKDPRCHGCGTALPVDDVPDGSEEDIACGKCGTIHASYPVPAWMAKMKNINRKKPVHVFCAIREGGTGQDAAGNIKPIAFNCVNCSGQLRFSKENLRIMECSYCGTRQYLPNDLWHAIHPADKIKPWYIRFK